MKRIIIFISLLIVVGCKSINTNEIWEGTGTIKLGFETSRFVPNDLEEHWWVTFDSDSAYNSYIDYAGPAKPQNDRIQFYNPVKCKIKGKVSELGRYGHMGFYDRKITIKEIVEILDENEN
tara:strand:- start:665 stop:1027 length:363 start_codon:yes stop_codon:yes gene_type:complete